MNDVTRNSPLPTQPDYSSLPDEDECANCIHGASLHDVWVGRNQPCTVPGCDCKDFIQPEYDDE